MSTQMPQSQPIIPPVEDAREPLSSDFSMPAGEQIFSRHAFTGKVFGITGGGNGIGRAASLLLVNHGATVLALDMDSDGLNESERLSEGMSGNLLGRTGDITDRRIVSDCFDELLQAHGKIDGWVNNAAVNVRAFIEEQAEEDLRRMLEVNLIAPWHVCQEIARRPECDGGSIVNISSIVATRSRDRVSAYAASKGGLEALTKSLAVELGSRGIRVNCIRPGYVFNDRDLLDIADPKERQLKLDYRRVISQTTAPLANPGRLADVANLAAFLLSDAARYITGATIPIDGGHSASMCSQDDARRLRGAQQLEDIRQELTQLEKPHPNGNGI